MNSRDSLQGVTLLVGLEGQTGLVVALGVLGAAKVVCLIGKYPDELDAIAHAVRDGGRQAHCYVGDPGHEGFFAGAVANIEADHGPIEVSVIAAEVARGKSDACIGSFAKFREMACFTCFLNALEVAKRMSVRRRGDIVFIESVQRREEFGSARRDNRGLALLAMSRNMAGELKSRQVRVRHMQVEVPAVWPAG